MGERVEMPHAGHFICGHMCQFHRNTYVNGYIVSTVGEYTPHHVFKKRGGERVLETRSDRDAFAFEELGYGRLYETMVFKAIRAPANERQCCPWRHESGENIDFEGYNDAALANAGHEEMVAKWADMTPEKLEASLKETA